MIENFKTEIFKLADFTETEWLFFSESLEIKTYEKGDFFIKEDEFCDYVGFINKGFFNFFYLIEGVQHIRGFFFPMNLFLIIHVFF